MDGGWTATTGTHHFIGNRWVASSGGQSLDVIDPSDGKPFARIARGNAADIDDAVLAARGAFGDGAGDWGRLSATERGRLLMKLAQRVLDHADELGRLESRTTGKPLKQGLADARALARYFEYYAGAADKLHGETIPYSAGMTVLTIREPHGVTGHIIPWNYPMQIFGRSVGAALAAGNACVVKPAEDACLSLLRVAELSAEVGFPDGALNIVTGLGSEAGAALAAHRGIDHISFTGSPVTGSAVAVAAARHHCPVTLELGGKSPQLVFADADLDAVVPVVVNAIVQNAGQTCSAGSRLLVERAVYEEVIARVGHAISQLRVGPALADLDVGPLIRQSQLQRVWDFLSQAQVDQVPIAAQGPWSTRRRRPASTRRPRCCATCRRRTRWRRTRSSARCWRRCRSTTKPRRSAWPTARRLASWPACGRATVRARCAWRGTCTAARCSSTTTAQAAASSCRSAA
jgi:aldehyde dehydrogenase (NAD+)